MDPRAFPLPGWHHIWVPDAQRVQRAARRRQTKGHETAFSAKKGFRATPRATGNSGQRGRKARSFAPNGLGPRLFQHLPSFGEKHRGHNARGWAGAGQGGSVFKKRPCESCLGGRFWTPRFWSNAARATPHTCQRGALWTHARSHCLAGIKSGSGTRSESNRPRGAAKRRATKRRFRPKRGSAQHPVQPAIRAKGVEKHYLLHRMGSDPVCFSIYPVSVRNIAATTRGGSFWTPLFGQRLRAQPPDTCQRGALWTHACSHTPSDIKPGSWTRGESDGPRGAAKRRAAKRLFLPKRGFAQHPVREFGPKGFEKRDLLHRMGSEPVCFRIDPVLVRNIAATTPGAGRAPAKGGRFSKNDPPRHVHGGGSFWTPLFGQRLRARPPHTCQRGAL